jgi:hypothetical protein
MKLKKLYIIFFIILSLSSLLISKGYSGDAVTHAQDKKNYPQYYIGLLVGKTDHTSSNFINDLNRFTSSNRYPAGHRITLGKNISSNFSVEVSYTDLGVMKRRADYCSGYESCGWDHFNLQRTDALDINFVFKKRINYLFNEIYVKAGPSLVHTRAHTVGINSGSPLWQNIMDIQKTSQLDIHIGLGVTKRIFRNLDFVFEVDKYDVNGGSEIALEGGQYQKTNIVSDDIYIYNIGLNYKF